MNRSRKRQILAIVDAALELPRDEREEYLSKTCGVDADLSGEVHSLLESIESANGFLDTPVGIAGNEFLHRLRPGDLIASRYTIDELIGVGGMGEVYRATDSRLDRTVALKVLSSANEEAAEWQRRFERELKTVAGLTHANVVALHDVVDDRQSQYAVMEWIDGQTLRQTMDGPMDWQCVCGLAEGMAAGLAAAHDAGIMHRDFKPDNVIIAHDGSAKVLDFGIARSESDTGDQSLTATTMTPGTAPYMSPEQAMGEKLTCATDVFSFGIVLYEMLAGINPFRRETALQTMRSICDSATDDLADCVEGIPRKLSSLVHSMLDRDPASRPTSAELVVAFRELDTLPVSISVAANEVPQEPLHSTQPTIAVLPFEVFSADANQGMFGDAIAHEITVDLSKLHWLKVIARGSAFQFRGAEIDLGKAGHVLNARYFVTGVITLHGETAVATVELSQLPGGDVIWADRFDCPIAELLQLRNTVSSQIATHVESRVQRTEVELAMRLPTENLDAWSAYHRGLWHMYLFTADGNREARKMFSLALNFDPRFARAHSGLSFTHFQDAFFGFSQDVGRARELARTSAQKSLELDDVDPFGNLTMGRCEWLMGDLQAAEGWLDRTLELRPSYAFASYNRGLLDALMNRGESSEQHALQALSNSPVDPLCCAFHGTRALSHIVRGDYEKSVECADQAARQPNAHFHIFAITAIANQLAGRHDVAGEHAKRIRKATDSYSAEDFFQAFQFQDPSVMQVMKQAMSELF